MLFRSSGFDLWIDNQEIDDSSAEISFKYFGENEKYGILVCLSDEHEYEVLLNGERFDFRLRGSGVIELTLDGAVQSGNIKINAIH